MSRNFGRPTQSLNPTHPWALAGAEPGTFQNEALSINTMKIRLLAIDVDGTRRGTIPQTTPWPDSFISRPNDDSRRSARIPGESYNFPDRRSCCPSEHNSQCILTPLRNAPVSSGVNPAKRQSFRRPTSQVLLDVPAFESSRDL